MTIAPCTIADIDAWLLMRAALWGEDAEDRDEALAMLEAPDIYCVFLAREDDRTIAFAEAAIRTDYVNGCDTSPVLFLEGIYVDPEYRKRGVARSLVNACAKWGRDHGLLEFASDAAIDNEASHAMHQALGFEETERVVYFKRSL